MENNPELFYFVATAIASVIGFVLAFIVNRFVNKLDQKMDNFDRLIELMQEEISELKQMGARFGTDIEHLKDKVFPVRYGKK